MQRFNGNGYGNRFQDVKCPFRVHVPAGESLFSVAVPQSYCDRSFYFSKLSLMPDYFSTQAATYGQDLEEELDSPVDNYSLYITLAFNVDRLFDSKRYDQELSKGSTPTRTIGELMTDINNYFETNKPAGMVRTPLFFDWIDTDLLEASKDSMSDVIKVTGNLYYDEPFEETKHGNRLPPSVSNMAGVNTTLFPSNLNTEDMQDRIRIRMHLAPACRVVFSTDAQLSAMGFTKDELGVRVGRRPLVLANSKRTYAVMQASDSPLFETEWTGPPYTKVHVTPFKDTWVSPEIKFNNFKRRDEQKNARLAEEVQKVIDKFALWSNWDLNFKYTSSNYTFVFNFPNNDAVRARLYVTPALAFRLGYGLVRHIDATSRPETKPEVTDIKELTKMALALVFDTGLVVVSLNNSSSNTTSNIDNLFMADLDPQPPGVLKMIGCDPTSLVQVPSYMTGSGASAAVSFVLSRFNEQGKPEPFAWKTGGYVNGVLTGIPPPSQFNQFELATAIGGKQYKRN